MNSNLYNVDKKRENMEKTLGIISGASIAYNRFLPALQESNIFQYGGVASKTEDKKSFFKEKFGGNTYDDYLSILEDEEIDSVYTPLPPAMHFEWGKKALEYGKHIFMEKPFTCSLSDTEQLVEIARSQKLALFENYAFVFHNQFEIIQKMLMDGELGELRLIRSVFCFPRRPEGDFRYDKSMGGGALLDCGGYPIKAASELLGDSAKVVYTALNKDKESDVDLYGDIVIQNDTGACAQLAFGMDNAYKCELEIIGQYGWIRASRFFTATSELEPVIEYNINNQQGTIVAERTNQFAKAIEHFNNLMHDDSLREEEYRKILQQAKLVQQVLDSAGCN